MEAQRVKEEKENHKPENQRPVSRNILQADAKLQQQVEV